MLEVLDFYSDHQSSRASDPSSEGSFALGLAQAPVVGRAVSVESPSRDSDAAHSAAGDDDARPSSMRSYIVHFGGPRSPPPPPAVPSLPPSTTDALVPASTVNPAPSSTPPPVAPPAQLRANANSSPPSPPTPNSAPERRLSSLTHAEIMARLRSVVNTSDPNLLFTKVEKIGQGAFGLVFSATSNAQGGSKVAIKQMSLARQKNLSTLALLCNEIVVMKETSHPNLVSFIDSFLVRSTELWVVMEHMVGDLTEIIDNHDLLEPHMAYICLEVSAGHLCPSFSAGLTAVRTRPARACSISTRGTLSTATSRATTS